MHFCIGAQFVRIQLNIAISKIINYIDDLEEVENNPIKFNGIYTRGATSYILKNKNFQKVN